MIDYVDDQIRHGFRLLSEQITGLGGQSLPHRSLYNQLVGNLESFCDNQRSNPRWVILTGLRGVGKTTIMAQLYVHLAQTLPRESCNLLYVSLDEIARHKDGSLNNLLDACELRWGGQFHSLDKPTFLFIDEIQVEPEAFNILKPVYDKASKLFLFCSGSAAINLHIGASVAGRRARLEKLYPLSFTEYHSLKINQPVNTELSEQLTRAIYLSDSADQAYQRIKTLSPEVNRYMAGLADQLEPIDNYLQACGLPFLLTSTNRLADSENIIRQVVLRDLPISRFNFTTDSVSKALTMINRLAEVTETPSLAKLSSDLGISSSLLNSILEAFCEAEILIKVPAFGRRSLSNSGRPAKYYFMSPTLRSALSNKYGDPATFLTQRGPLLEDLVALYLYRQFVSNHHAQLKFWQHKKHPSGDFILEFTSRRIAIEVGWGSKSTSQIKSTMDKVKCDYGLVFSRSELSLSDDKKVVSVPLDHFLLT